MKKWSILHLWRNMNLGLGLFWYLTQASSIFGVWKNICSPSSSATFFAGLFEMPSIIKKYNMSAQFLTWSCWDLPEFFVWLYYVIKEKLAINKRWKENFNHKVYFCVLHILFRDKVSQVTGTFLLSIGKMPVGFSSQRFQFCWHTYIKQKWYRMLRIFRSTSASA